MRLDHRNISSRTVKNNNAPQKKSMPPKDAKKKEDKIVHPND